jgi:hypothetical protein
LNLVLIFMASIFLFRPPLKLIIGSVTTSVAIVIGGVALMVLPTLIVGNELDFGRRRPLSECGSWVTGTGSCGAWLR